MGVGTWTIEPREQGRTRATIAWQVEVCKPLVRRLTPLLRPLFAWNHRWAMRRGAVYLGDLLGAAETPSQRLVDASVSPVATGGSQTEQP